METVKLKVWGDLACFTRPDLKTERHSYPVITPSAARGIVDSIMWKPSVFWAVRRISILRPIRYFGFRRNEVSRKAGREPFYADAEQVRMQRYTLALKDVAYVIDVEPILTDRAGPDETPTKFVEMLTRRVKKGQCFSQPALGLREFTAAFGPPDDEQPLPLTQNFGVVLHDIDYRNGRRPQFFNAAARNGIIEVPDPQWVRK